MFAGCKDNEIHQSSNSFLHSCGMERGVMWNNHPVGIATYKPPEYMAYIEHGEVPLTQIKMDELSAKYRDNIYVELKLSNRLPKDLFSESVLLKSIVISIDNRIVTPSMLHIESLMNIAPYKSVLLMFPKRENDDISELTLLIKSQFLSSIVRFEHIDQSCINDRIMQS